jgi:hypothetical protein
MSMKALAKLNKRFSFKIKKGKIRIITTYKNNFGSIDEPLSSFIRSYIRKLVSPSVCFFIGHTITSYGYGGYRCTVCNKDF